MTIGQNYDDGLTPESYRPALSPSETEAWSIVAKLRAALSASEAKLKQLEFDSCWDQGCLMVMVREKDDSLREAWHTADKHCEEADFAEAKALELSASEARIRELRQHILDMMRLRGWSVHWIHRSAYLHLEASELAEAVRGKRGDTLDESADVLITLLALSPHNLDDIIKTAEGKIVGLLSKPPYESEYKETLSPPEGGE